MARRNNLDQLEPSELAIVSAVEAVESMPADTRLTEAVILLGQARDKVADYVDELLLLRKARLAKITHEHKCGGSSCTVCFLLDELATAKEAAKS